MRQFGEIYRNRKVLVTGHTGFKGSWLSLWLQELGAELHGVALAPESSPSHWELLDLETPESRVDVRDFDAVARSVEACRPEIVFHLAAQPLVRRSYRDPIESWSTNVMGTANLLQACRQSESVRAVVVVTTDKVYLNRESRQGYREEDPLGGHDPYSASKAAAEGVVSSFRSAFSDTPQTPLLATARAGNVIGGGDWSEDRLVPDLVRALHAKKPLEIRAPSATRPWQHVLDSLSGYLVLGQRLLEEGGAYAGAWNFGPDAGGSQSVAEVLGRLQSHWPDLKWQGSADPQPHETTLLHLDSSKARRELEWFPVWSLEETLAATALWYRSYLDDGRLASRAQLAGYVATAQARQAVWVAP